MSKGTGVGNGLQADLGAGFVMERFPLFSELSFAHGACALLVPGPQKRSWGRLFGARSGEQGFGVSAEDTNPGSSVAWLQTVCSSGLVS